MLVYTVTGTDGAGREFTVEGSLNGTNNLDPQAIQQVFVQVFEQLTHGRAKFGQPGRGGCKGRYLKLLNVQQRVLQ